MVDKGVKITVATILGKRLTSPMLWKDIKDPWSKSRTITEMTSLFPDFDSLKFTHSSLDIYEDLYKTIEESDRLKLLQLVTYPFYEHLKADVVAKKCKLVMYPNATSGKILAGFIATSSETRLKHAYISLEMTVKSLKGEKHSQMAVMERRSDPQLPEYWKIGLIADNSNK